MSIIHLTIDSLSISGLDVAERKAFLASLQGELHRVLSDPTTRSEWAKPHRTPVLRLNRQVLDPGLQGARKLGTQVAKNIGKGLKP